MTLPAGARLGPYEVLSPLGAGGMGEVYRARDTRLSREVAIKVLSAELAGDPSRMRRFEKEARAASALNHPNIVTIYEIGSADSASYIAMERVEGSTLRELLVSGPFPTKKLLQVATQIADGLAKAHEAGIVHRDLKPENVMVTKDALVKILDFGLAKLTQRSSGSREGSPLPSETRTSPGVVVGTASYMSPEQASGEEIDFRSDQFSFGSILYEMATGKRAFSRKTGVDTLAAILNEDPEPIATISPQTPAPLRWIVDRCLAKEPEDRYASTKDLSRDLAGLRDRFSQSSESIAALVAPRRRWGPALAALAGLCLLVAAAAVGWLAHRPRSDPPVYHRVTFRRGTIGGARFTPDGQSVVYAATWEGQDPQIFSARLDDPQSAPLGLPSADLSSISKSGKMAIRLAPKGPLQPTLFGSPPPIGTLAEVSVIGGSPRELLESVSDADYSPDGSSLVVVRSVDGRDRLELPIGKVLYEAAPGVTIAHPRFSPKGDGIAFVEISWAEGRLSLALVDLAGKRKTTLSPLTVGFALAWNPKTDEVWVTDQDPARGWVVVAMSRSGRRRVVASGTEMLLVREISRDGRALISSVRSSAAMSCLPPGGAKEVDLAWLDFSHNLDISDDGREVLFWEFGGPVGSQSGVYLRRSDGSPAIRLRNAFATTESALSPDKKWALSFSASGDSILLLPTGAGETRTLRTEGMFYQTGRWFPDGKRVLVQGSHGPGSKTSLFIQDVAGSPPRPLAPEGVEITPISATFSAAWSNFAISRDGTQVAAHRPDGTAWLYQIVNGQRRPLPGIQPTDNLIRWDESGESLYLSIERQESIRIDRYDVASGRRQLWKELTPSDPSGIAGMGHLTLTPDGKSYVYTVEKILSDLYVVDGLR